MDEFWAEMTRPGPERAVVRGVEIRKGSRVRLHPRAGGDVLDLALAGKVAVVEALDEDDAGRLHVSVTLDDDPGRDLGEGRFLGHRFFFSAEEVEPLDAGAAAAVPGRVLIAGIGNLFLGDDGFGSEVARRLAERDAPPGVDVVDFGIRAMDLAYALQREYAAAILIDAVPRGGAPGTLYLLEPELDAEGVVVLETHAMDPVKVLRLAQAMGGVPPRVLLVGCEPDAALSGDSYDEMRMELSDCVRAAVPRAVEMVESLLAELTAPGEPAPSS
jgi:hydrogenase maturation protease